MAATFYDLGEKVLCICPKSGSQSIRKALLTDLDVREVQLHGIKNTPALQNKPVVWFVRHPVSRLASAYRYFEKTIGWPTRETRITPGISYEGFIDSVLEHGPDNRHWAPQTPMVTYTRFFLPTEIYRFEDINTLWPKVVGKGVLKRENPSNPYQADMDYRLDELVTLYADDLKHWVNARQPH